MMSVLLFGAVGQALGADGVRRLIACRTDQTRYCPGDSDTSPKLACLNQHHVSLSLSCRRALAAARAARSR